MAIDKSFGQAPLGLDQLDPAEMGDEPAMEITIEDPESVEIGIDGQPLLKIEEAPDEEEDFSANLAEEMSPKDLDRKSTRLNSSHSQQSRMPSSA